MTYTVARRYFEVEVEYSGTKVFHIPINDMMNEQDALKYIADHYSNLERDGNAAFDMINTKLLALNYREER